MSGGDARRPAQEFTCGESEKRVGKARGKAHSPMKTPGTRPGVFTSRAVPANRCDSKKFEDYFEAAAEAAGAFFSALCAAFLAGAEAAPEAASAAKAPTANMETIRAARSLVILRYLK